jgi:hypothetical protein
MAATSAQIEAVISLEGEYSLITGAVTITDNSAWGSIGVATPDTAKFLLWIVDSAGNDVYKNAGWDAGTYTSPDLSLLDTTYTFTLPTDIAGDYLQGQYTFYLKVQVVESGETTVVQKTIYQNVSATCNDIVIDVEGGVIAGTTDVRLTDNTSYKTYTSLSRTMILYPPPPSGQANQTGTNVDTIVYSGTVYTGVWTWKITSDVTYTDAITGASTTCRLTGQGTFNVQQSQLCKVLCLLEKYRTQFWVLKGQKNSNYTNQLERYTLAMLEYEFATNAYICGKSQTVIDGHIQKIYDITGIDPDCDCGCDDGTSQILLNVTTVDGTDGTDGLNFRQGAGAPASGLGSVGDSYLDNATGNVYLKTGASTWTFTINVVGAAGATGAAGASGVAVLHNDITDDTTVGTSLEILKTYTLPANTLSSDGSYLRVRAVFSTSTANLLSATKLVGLYFNGNSIADSLQPLIVFSADYNNIVLEATINRYSNTELKNEIYGWGGVDYGSGYVVTAGGVGYQTNFGIFSMAGLNLTTTGYDITAKANSEAIGDITCELLEVTHYVK